MESEMKHFNHEHPLFLLKAEDQHSEDVIACQGCRKEITGGPYYSCRQCEYCLHKLCADLQSEINHFMHPDHRLKLLTSLPYEMRPCDGCRERCDGFYYCCSMCDFNLDRTCAVADMKHFSHEHPLFVVKADDEHLEDIFICEGCQEHISEEDPYYSCRKCDNSYRLHKYCVEIIYDNNNQKRPDNPDVMTLSRHKHPLTLNDKKCGVCKGRISKETGPLYRCVKECGYNLHKVCVELPIMIEEHPLHSQHTLTLISTPSHPPYNGSYQCDWCSGIGSKFSYNCSECEFDLHPLCSATPPPLFMNHFRHEHTLFLKPEKNKTEDDDDLIANNNCDGCKTPIVGPFYTCPECEYFLHKACAELPREMNHWCHPQHPLTHLPGSSYDKVLCQLCREDKCGFVYRCSICSFNVDIKCASSTYSIVDNCHPHPLISLPTPTSLLCDICRTDYKGLFYKCTSCPFFVHQNCTLLQAIVQHSCHDHLLTLLPLVPSEDFKICKSCDICYDKLQWFQCVYSCIDCMFFAHVSCATSEITESLSRLVYLIIVINIHSTDSLV